MTWALGNNVVGTYSPVLRKAGWHQTDVGLLWIPPTFIHSVRGDLTSAITRSVQRMGIRFKRFELLNANGDARNVGIGTRYANRFWRGGRLSADGVTFTDGTTALQAPSAFTAGVTGANQTGIVVGCVEKFDWMSADCTTAETNAGGSTVVDHTVYYSTKSAGVSAWSSAVTSGLTDTFTTSNAVWAQGVLDFVWHAPSDWEPNDGTLCNGDLKGYYLFRVGAADREASDVAAIFTGLEIGRMHAVKSVAAGGIFENEFIEYFDPLGDGIVAYFSAANAANRVYVEAIGG